MYVSKKKQGLKHFPIDCDGLANHLLMQINNSSDLGQVTPPDYGWVLNQITQQPTHRLMDDSSMPHPSPVGRTDLMFRTSTPYALVY